MACSIHEIDIRKLIGGVAFTVSCNLSANGNTVTTIYALPDTGAHGFAFMDTRCAMASAKFLGVPLRKLQDPIAIKGYDGREGRAVTHFLECTLTIDGRRLTLVPFLVLDLGNHDLILGSQWFEYYDVKPDLRRRRLEWPASLPACPHYAREIKRSLQELYNEELEVTAASHQAEVYKRDRAFAQEDRQRAAGRASQVSILARASPSPKRTPDFPALAQEIQNVATPEPLEPSAEHSEALSPSILLEPSSRSPELPSVP